MKYKNKTTGEEVKPYNKNYYICSDTTCIPKRFIENSCDWEKVKEPLFTTEDGVDIYDDEERVWDTSDINWDFLFQTPTKYMKDIVKRRKHRKAWARKENAEEYIKQNEKKYSLKDMVRIANHWAYIKTVTPEVALKVIEKW